MDPIVRTEEDVFEQALSLAAGVVVVVVALVGGPLCFAEQ